MVLSSRRTAVSYFLPTLTIMSDDVAFPRPRGASTPDTCPTRLLAGLLAGALLIAIASPARRLGRDGEEVRDSFPFSHFPMFSAPRKSHYWVTHLLGIEADGTTRPLHYSYLGTGGLNAVRRQVRRRVREGDGPLLAEHAAALVASRNRLADRTVRRVHVVRGRYLVDPFMRGTERAEFTTKLQVSGSADVPGRTPPRTGADPVVDADESIAR